MDYTTGKIDVDTEDPAWDDGGGMYMRAKEGGLPNHGAHTSGLLPNSWGNEDGNVAIKPARNTLNGNLLNPHLLQAKYMGVAQDGLGKHGLPSAYRAIVRR